MRFLRLCWEILKEVCSKASPVALPSGVPLRRLRERWRQHRLAVYERRLAKGRAIMRVKEAMVLRMGGKIVGRGRLDHWPPPDPDHWLPNLEFDEQGRMIWDAEAKRERERLDQAFRNHMKHLAKTMYGPNSAASNNGFNGGP